MASQNRSRPTRHAVTRLTGHGRVFRDNQKVLDTDYEVMVVQPGNAREPNARDITGRLLGPFFQGKRFADHVHTLVLADGRAFEFRVIRPDTNEIAAVSGLHTFGEAYVYKAF